MSSSAGGIERAPAATFTTDNIDFGMAYEVAVLSPEGLTDDRFTFDF